MEKINVFVRFKESKLKEKQRYKYLVKQKMRERMSVGSVARSDGAEGHERV